MSRRKQTNPFKVDDGDLRRSKRHMKCNVCGKILASALSLARHKLTHSQNKTYPCPKCDASFKTSSNMHRHMRIHTRQKSNSVEKTQNVVTKTPNLRSPRQNIRTPNKFKEFDVDLVGRGSTLDQDSDDPSPVQENNSGRAKKKFATSEKAESKKEASEPKINGKRAEIDAKADLENVEDQDLFCHVCHKSFISKFGLITHSLLHLDQSTQCNLCDQNFSTHEGLVMHNVIVHKIIRNKNENGTKSHLASKGFLDLVCVGFSVNKFPEIAEDWCTQVQHSHPKKDSSHVFVCKKCDKAFPLLESLSIHIKKVHSSKEKPVERKKSEKEAFIDILELKSKRSIDKKRKVESTISNGMDDDHIYASASVVSSNIPSWMQDNPDLESSGYKTAVIANRTAPVCTEMVPYTNERNVFWCRICNYSSHEKSAIVRHLLTHSGIRPYFCKICKYAFTTKANCERHVRKRHNLTERSELNKAVGCDWEMLKKAPRDDIYMISGSNSSCPVCNKSFPCKNDLKEHLKEHEERQFICQLCNIRCTTRNNCVRHILHKHPGIPHTQANDIIIFAGRGRNLQDRNVSLPSPNKKTSGIDISKGSLQRRNVSDRRSNFIKWKTSRPGTGFIQRPLSKPKSTSPFQNSINRSSRVHMDAPKVPSDVPEDLGNTTDENATPNGPRKIPRLIPLMKIKAYNEAAIKSYKQMVALYKGLNAQAFMMHKKSALEKLSRDSGIEQQETAAVEIEKLSTAFICWACSAVFDSENDLNCHLTSCDKRNSENNGLENDVFAGVNEDASVEPSSDLQADQDDLSYPFLADFQDANYATNDDGMDWTVNSIDADDEQNILDEDNSVNATESQNELLGNMGEALNLSQGTNTSENADMYNEGYENVGDWVEKIVPRSPNSNRSSDTPVNSDLSAPLPSDIPRVFAKSSKEPSHFEDTLLMSMFNENKSGKHNENNSVENNFSSISKYSSSLPTMVNMETSTLSRRGYQIDDEMENSFGEEKVLVPSKGRFYTARKCPQCDKSFPWASSLRRHIMTHTGLKLYMCRLCKMRFTTRSNLIRHVYRRHGMAKQHPDFASCLAKLHPSDTLLREVEADVRRRVETQRKSPHMDQFEEEEPQNHVIDDIPQLSGKKRTHENDFQSMLEEDPETLLVDLDYSPRDDFYPVNKKKMTTTIKSELDDNYSDKEEGDSLVIAEDESQEEAQDQPLDMSLNDSAANELPEVPQEAEESSFHGGKSLRLRSRKSALEQKKKESEVAEKTRPVVRQETKPKMKNKQSTQFVCGLCKKIFKTVPDLVEHLDTHDVPHSWHCSVCGVPFTNKYNCQRHLIRRHARSDIEPVYVEDSKHGPRTARGLPRKNPLAGNEEGNSSV